jgi:hypothetical protein
LNIPIDKHYDAKQHTRQKNAINYFISGGHADFSSFLPLLISEQSNYRKAVLDKAPSTAMVKGLCVFKYCESYHNIVCESQPILAIMCE